MNKFIYTSIEKKDFGHTLKKELIQTSYNSLKYDETVEKLTNALNLAKEQIRNVRNMKDFNFWTKQENVVRELLDKQERLRKYDLDQNKRKLEAILNRFNLKLETIEFQKKQLFLFDFENLQEIYNELKQLKLNL